MSQSYELGMIGAGNMAEAIVRGVIRAGVLGAGQIIASDLSASRREFFARELGVQVADDNAQVGRQAKTVILSIKPQQMSEALAGVGSAMSERTLIISIMAGISSAAIARQLGAERPWRIVRTMPNTPMLAGEGMVVISAGQHARPEDLATARRIFEAGATVLELPEDRMDAVTAISGSGPAYFFFLVEQMIKAGVELGLTAEQAHLLATRTATGAAKMMALAADSPQELRRKVTSPGGTTQAAIETMEARGVGAGIVAGVKRAAERSKELGG